MRPFLGRLVTTAVIASCVTVAVVTTLRQVCRRPPRKPPTAPADWPGFPGGDAPSNDVLGVVAHELRTPLNSIIGWTSSAPLTPFVIVGNIVERRMVAPPAPQ